MFSNRKGQVPNRRGTARRGKARQGEVRVVRQEELGASLTTTTGFSVFLVVLNAADWIGPKKAQEGNMYKRHRLCRFRSFHSYS